MLFTTILKYGNHYWNAMFFRFLLSGFLLYLIVYFTIYISDDYLRAFILVVFSLTAFFMPNILSNPFIRKKYFSKDFDRFSVPTWVEDHYKNIHTVYNSIYAIKSSCTLQYLEKNLNDYEKTMLAGVENADRYALKTWVIPSIPKIDLIMIRLHLLGIILFFVSILGDVGYAISGVLNNLGLSYYNKAEIINLTTLLSAFIFIYFTHIYFSWGCTVWHKFYDPKDGVLSIHPTHAKRDNQSFFGFSLRKMFGYIGCLIIFGLMAILSIFFMAILLKSYIMNDVPSFISSGSGGHWHSNYIFIHHIRIFIMMGISTFSVSFFFRLIFDIFSEIKCFLLNFL